MGGSPIWRQHTSSTKYKDLLFRTQVEQLHFSWVSPSLETSSTKPKKNKSSWSPLATFDSGSPLHGEPREENGHDAAEARALGQHEGRVAEDLATPTTQNPTESHGIRRKPPETRIMSLLGLAIGSSSCEKRGVQAFSWLFSGCVGNGDLISRPERQGLCSSQVKLFCISQP